MHHPGVTVSEAHGIDDVRRACGLIDATWRKAVVPVELGVAISHAGGYVALATAAGGEVVGASIAFLARSGGEPALHSHVTAVAASRRGGGIGFALKQHQRSWSLARGIGVVTWTFDPLRRANAWFNLVKLGATAVALHADFYGAMDDAFNAGDLTDRLEVRWQLASPAAEAAARGQVSVADDASLLEHGAAVVLDASADGGPAPAPAAVPVRLVGLPDDPDALADRPERRQAWRLALRQALGDAFADGLTATGMTAAGRYVLA